VHQIMFIAVGIWL